MEAKASCKKFGRVRKRIYVGRTWWKFGSRKKALISMQASVERIERLRSYLVDQFGERLHDGDLRVQAPRGVFGKKAEELI